MQKQKRLKNSQNFINSSQEQYLDSSKLISKQQSFVALPDNKCNYQGGTHPYQVVLKCRGINFVESNQNEYEPIDFMDHFRLHARTVEDIQAKKTVAETITRDKIQHFHHIYQPKDSNEVVYKTAFNKVIKKFLNAQNQSIFVMGGEQSGKNRAMFGNLRDPGFITNILKDLFNELYDNSDCDDIIFKLSFVNYDTQRQEFHDLLVNTRVPLIMTSDSISDIHLVGISECIVNNLKTALKLYRSALLNLYGHVQGTEKEKVILSNSNFIMQIKAELPPKENMGSEILVSKLKVIKISYEKEIIKEKKRFLDKDENEEKQPNVQVALRKVLKQLSDFSYKTKKNTQIQFRMNPLMEYLSESLAGNSQTYLYVCINNLSKYHQESLNYLKLGQFCQQISTTPVPTKISFIQQNLTQDEIKEEIKKTLYIWLMEFSDNEHDIKKVRRQQTIIKHLKKVEEVFSTIIPYFENLQLLISQMNMLYSQILQNYCNSFSKQITCENIQEFYLAKLQPYVIEDLEIQNQLSINFCRLIIDEIIECKIKIDQYFVQLKNALRLWGKKDKKPQYINNYDVEKFIGIGKLCKKWLEVNDLFANYNHFEHEKAVQDYNSIFGRLIKVFEEFSDKNRDPFIQSSINDIRTQKFLNSDLKIEEEDQQQQQTTGNNPFQEQDNESDNNITRENNNLDKIPSKSKINNIKIPSMGNNNDTNIQKKENINYLNTSFSINEESKKNLDQQETPTKAQEFQKCEDDLNKRLNFMKQQIDITPQEKSQRRMAEKLFKQDYFYVKNHKIRTGKLILNNVRRQQRLSTASNNNDNSNELDDELVKNLFQNELLRLKSYAYERQYRNSELKSNDSLFMKTQSILGLDNKRMSVTVTSSIHKQDPYFQQYTARKVKETPRIQQQLYQSSVDISSGQNQSRQGPNNKRNTNYNNNKSPLSRKKITSLNLAKNKSENQIKIQYQQQQQQQYDINPLSSRFGDEEDETFNYIIGNKQRQTMVSEHSSLIKQRLGQASQHQFSSFMLKQQDSILSRPDFSQDSIYKSHQEQIRKKLQQQEFQKEKQIRLQKTKDNKLPKVLGLEKFKFKLPKIEYSSLTDQIMCSKFTIPNTTGNSVINNNNNYVNNSVQLQQYQKGQQQYFNSINSSIAQQDKSIQNVA